MGRAAVRLGCSAALSGEEAQHGQQQAAAVRLAVLEAQGRADLPVALELVVVDDAGDGERAAEVARAFVADRLVAGVVGPATSETALAAAPIYHSGRLTHISPAASAPVLTALGYDTFFRTVSDDRAQGRVAARLIAKHLGCRTVGIVHDGTAFGLPLADVVRDELGSLGAQVALFEGIARGQRDFTRTIERVKKAAPDLLYCALIEAEGAAFAAQLRQAGMMVPLFGADALKPSRFLETPGYPAPGPYYTSASTDVTRAPSATHFRRVFGSYSIYTAEAYDAALILIEAIRRGGGADREQVRSDVSRTAGFPGASGTVTFDEHGDLAVPHIDFYRADGGELQFVGAAHEIAGAV